MTCPNLLPSLDHPSGFYCRVGCGGNCHNASNDQIHSDSNAIPRVLGDDQGDRAAGLGGQRPEQLAHPKPDFTPGSKVWLLMTYYGVATWAEFTIVDQDHATTSTVVNGQTVVDTLVVNDWFKERARSQPPQPPQLLNSEIPGANFNDNAPTASDSLKTRRSSDLEGCDRPQDFTLENVSDSLKPRESQDENSWLDDADPGDEDDQLYAMFCQSGRFWHEAGAYTSKGRLYYRYRWGHGHRIEGVRHIPGGNLRRGLVKERAAIVERAVYVDFRPHHEIVALIDGWRRRRTNRA